MGRDVVVVGASAGGVEALRTLVGGLPRDFAAAVLVVLHIAPTSRSALPEILRRAGKLPVDHASHGEALKPGQIYVAPPDYHLLVRDGTVALGHGPRENGHRPAVDPLFRSAARWHGPAVSAVVLSGTLDDGAAGVAIVAARGGRVLVQDPTEALYDGMPRAALRVCKPDGVAIAAAMAPQLVAWSLEVAPGLPPPVDRDLAVETDVAELDDTAMSDPDRPGTPAGLSCPDCNGSLFEISTDVLRFRCRVGHAWSPESLAAEQGDEVEAALWVAIRSLEEKAALRRRLSRAATERANDPAADFHAEKADEAAERARTIRRLVSMHMTLDHPDHGH
jgi:two-component system chemotaxis response regulator CheB